MRVCVAFLFLSQLSRVKFLHRYISPESFMVPLVPRPRCRHISKCDGIHRCASFLHPPSALRLRVELFSLAALVGVGVLRAMIFELAAPCVFSFFLFSCRFAHLHSCISMCMHLCYNAVGFCLEHVTSVHHLSSRQFLQYDRSDELYFV
jgi:hypothetical protein